MYKINLQPKVKLEGPDGIQIPWVVVVVFVLLAGATMGVMARSLNFQIKDLRAQEKQADDRLADYQGILDDLDQAKEDESFKTGKRDFIKGISNAQKLWLGFFDDFKEKMPQDIWVERMKVSRNGDYTLSGKTFSYGAVGNFMVKMISMPHIQSVSLVGTGKTGGSGNQTRNRLSSVVDVRSFKFRGRMRLVRERMRLIEPEGETEAEADEEGAENSENQTDEEDI